MICTCLSKPLTAAALHSMWAREPFDMAEIRLDKMALTNTEIMQLFSQASMPLVATFRADNASDTLRMGALKTAIIAGAAYVDIEMDAPYLEELMAVAHENQCKVILSYHNFDHTPRFDELKKILEQMWLKRPDYFKIVTLAHSNPDTLPVMQLYKLATAYQLENRLLAFCMGDAGKGSRILSCRLGAPFIYAASPDNTPTAEGQLTISEAKEILATLPH